MKNKKAAESQFRKIRLAYEGPKFPKNKVKKPTDDKDKDGESETQEKPKFKPTATKKEFVSDICMHCFPCLYAIDINCMIPLTPNP